MSIFGVKRASDEPFCPSIILVQKILTTTFCPMILVIIGSHWFLHPIINPLSNFPFLKTTSLPVPQLDLVPKVEPLGFVGGD